MFKKKLDISKMYKTQDVRGLIKALKDENPVVRWEAARHLGYLKAQRAVQSLIAALNDEKHLVRLNAAEALGEIGDPAAAVPLVKMLKSVRVNEPRDPREAAAAALGKLGLPGIDGLISALDYDDNDVYYMSIWVLKDLKDTRIADILLEALKYHSSHQVRTTAADALCKRKVPQAIQPLIDLVGDPNEKVSKEAIWALNGMISLWNAEHFLKYLENRNTAIRDFAIHALGKIKDPVAVRPLLEILIKEPNADVIDALGEIGDPQVVSFLDQFSASKVWRVRFSTACALVKIGGEAVVPLLSSMLGDSDESVAKVAIEGLGVSGTGLAVSPLLDALQKENNQTRRAMIVDSLAMLYKSQKLGEHEKITILQMKEQLDAWHHDKAGSIHVDVIDTDHMWEHSDRYDHDDQGVRIRLE